MSSHLIDLVLRDDESVYHRYKVYISLISWAYHDHWIGSREILQYRNHPWSEDGKNHGFRFRFSHQSNEQSFLVSYHHTEVSWVMGVPPLIIHLKRTSHCKPLILGIPHLINVQDPSIIPFNPVCVIGIPRSWMTVIPNILATIIPYNHKPTGVLNTARSWTPPNLFPLLTIIDHIITILLIIHEPWL